MSALILSALCKTRYNQFSYHSPVCVCQNSFFRISSTLGVSFVFFQSEDLPVSFEFSKIAHFAATPSSGRLLPLQSLELRMSFLPRNLGEFRGEITLKAEDGIQYIKLPLHGLALVYSNDENATRKIIGGTDKIPVDFKYAISLTFFTFCSFLCCPLVCGLIPPGRR